MKSLNEDLKTGEFKQIYLLYGEEVYLKKQYKDRLSKAIVNEGDTMNYSYYEGKGIHPGELIDLAETMPFFSERRLIVVENSGFFKNATPELADYLKELPETSYFLFVEEEVDKRGKLYKAVKAKGRIVELGRQDEHTLVRWILGMVKREGKQISERTVQLLLAKTGDDMENISSELEKLISYTLGRDIVTDEDVETICTTQVTNKIFDMISAISARQTRKAMDLYEDLLTLKEPPMRILFLIARQFNQILQVKELVGKGMDKGTIASKLKLQPFVVGKIMLQAKTFSKEQILSYVNLCVDAEEGVKTGKLQDRLAVELLITNQY